MRDRLLPAVLALLLAAPAQATSGAHFVPPVLILTETVAGEDHVPAPRNGNALRLAGEHDVLVEEWGWVDHDPTGILGNALVSVGDVTGDGVGDLAAFEAQVKIGNDEGCMYLVPGGFPPGVSGIADVATQILMPPDPFGNRSWISGSTGSASIPDVDGDGVDDLLISNSLWDFFGPHPGAVYLMTGPWTPGTSIDVSTAWATWLSSGRAGEFGTSVAAGDITGDGATDLLVTAPDTPDAYGHISGAAFVFVGPLTPGSFTAADAVLSVRTGPPPPVPPHLAIGIGDHAFLVDLTADGQADVVVTAAASTGPMADYAETGTTYAWEGPIGADLSIDAATGTLEGEVERDAIGVFAATLGDTDGDGYQEFGLSSSNGFQSVGSAWIVNGMPEGTAAIGEGARVHVEGIDTWDSAGHVAAAGDLDDDGFDDVAVGALELGPASFRWSTCSMARSPLGHGAPTRPPTR